jgi:hypothetical protein
MITFSSEEPSNITVNMLRTNGSHFRLLWPRDAPVIPKAKVSVKKSKEESPKEVPLVISRPKRSVTLKKSKAESPTRSKSVSRNRTSSLENALMKIALQESKETKKPLKEAKKEAKKTLKQTKTNKKESKKINNLNNNFYNAWENASKFLN